MPFAKPHTKHPHYVSRKTTLTCQKWRSCRGLLDNTLEFSWNADGHQFLVFSICRYFFNRPGLCFSCIFIVRYGTHTCITKIKFFRNLLHRSSPGNILFPTPFCFALVLLKVFSQRSRTPLSPWPRNAVFMPKLLGHVPEDKQPFPFAPCFSLPQQCVFYSHIFTSRYMHAFGPHIILIFTLYLTVNT